MLQCPQDQSQAPSSPGQSAANPENPSKNPKNRISPSLTTEGGHLKRPTSPTSKTVFFFLKKAKKKFGLQTARHSQSF